MDLKKIIKKSFRSATYAFIAMIIFYCFLAIFEIREKGFQEFFYFVLGSLFLSFVIALFVLVVVFGVLGAYYSFKDD